MKGILEMMGEYYYRGGRPAPPYYRFKVSMFPGGRFKAIALDLGRRRPGLDHCGLRLLGNTPSLNEGGTLQEMSSIRTPFHWLFNPYAGFRMAIQCKGWPGNNHHLTVPWLTKPNKIYDQ
eukprot:Gb_31678 [translate_table: standard]